MADVKKYRAARKPRCRQCKQRKVKCDNVVPCCGACKKTGLTCNPYQQQFVFVSSTPNESTQKQQLISLSRQNGPTLPTAYDLVQCPMLSPSQTQNDYFEQFLRFNYGSAPVLSDASTYLWASTIRTNQQQFQPLRDVGCALGALIMGKANCDPGLRQYSLKLYSNSLAATRDMWSTIDKTNWLNPSLTVTLLFSYEQCVMESLDESKKSLNHGLGFASVLQLAGPESFHEAIAHCFFLHTRNALIYTALLQERPCFLANDEWMHEPWRLIPKNKHHQCLDILAMVPTLFWLFSKIADGVKHGLDVESLLDEFDRQLLLVREMLQVFQHSSAAGGQRAALPLVAKQNCLACELMIHDAIQRVGRISDAAPFASYATAAKRRIPAMTVIADTIIATLQDFNIEQHGFLRMRVILVPARAAIQFLRREMLDQARPGCAKVVKAIKDGGFYHLLTGS